ncbi:MAG: acetyltransferase [Mycobacterium sp.]|nr:acetyltransferase [Mycobacterium sp.]
MRKGAAPAAHHDVSAHRPWTHELAELAALFLTVGAAHLLANILGHQQHGPYLLVGAGMSLLVVSAVVRLTQHHRRVRRRAAATASAGVASAGVASVGATAGSAARRAAGDGSRLWRIRTILRDDPGELAGLATVLGSRGVNILGVQLYPLADGVADEFVVEAPPWFGAGDLADTVRTGHGAHTEVTRADVRDLGDLPTRVLRLARRVIADPDALPDALAELCGACTVVVLPSAADPGPELDGTTLRLGDGSGRDLVVSRPMSPFTPTEYARAQALVELTRAGRTAARPDRG